MALVLFEKPTAPKRIPANGDNPAAFGFHFVLNPAFIDEMHDDADRQSGADGKKKNLQAIHGEIKGFGAIVAHFGSSSN